MLTTNCRNRKSLLPQIQKRLRLLRHKGSIRAGKRVSLYAVELWNLVACRPPTTLNKHIWTLNNTANNGTNWTKTWNKRHINLLCRGQGYVPSVRQMPGDNLCNDRRWESATALEGQKTKSLEQKRGDELVAKCQVLQVGWLVQISVQMFFAPDRKCLFFKC